MPSKLVVIYYRRLCIRRHIVAADAFERLIFVEQFETGLLVSSGALALKQLHAQTASVCACCYFLKDSMYTAQHSRRQKLLLSVLFWWKKTRKTKTLVSNFVARTVHRHDVKSQTKISFNARISLTKAPTIARAFATHIHTMLNAHNDIMRKMLKSDKRKEQKRSETSESDMRTQGDRESE